ncbi:MAG TPA: DNA helicase PcrA [Actinomycetota bacterium]|nr:DNA helicase PcrA [Actinomycetota bacterium]
MNTHLEPSHDLLSGLNEPQRQAVTHGDGPMLIVAGAGSGKTAVLTRRIAYLIAERGVSPFAILAITFTNKAANEVKERVAAAVGPVARKMWIGTFHAACVRVLRSQISNIGYRSAFTIYDSADSERLISYIMRDGNFDPKRLKPAGVLQTISRAKDELITPEAYEAGATNWRDRQISSIYTAYQKRLREANAVDFDDIINLTIRIFTEFPDVLRHYRERWQHIMVDEFQDTNGAQFELVRLLAHPDGNVVIVGDMDQSVYGFRGADYRNLARFEEAFPTAKVVTLEQNYRSTQRILSAANALIENNRARKPKNLWTDLGTGELITCFYAGNEHDEAAFVAVEIERLRETEGFRFKDAAVFYRTNAQSRVVEEVFTRFGIPYRIIGGVRFYERKEVKDLLAYLSVLVNPSDTVSLRRIVNTPRRGIGERSIAELEGYAATSGLSLYEAMQTAAYIPSISQKAISGLEAFFNLMEELRGYVERGAGIAKVIQATWERSGYMAELEAERSIEALGRVENVKELAGVAAEFEQRSPEGSLEDFLAQIRLVTEQDEYDEEESAVTLMTLHNAKGLEFPIVFIVGFEDGVFPHMRSLTEPEELEEERRLAYVGITRAKQRLYLTHALNRSLWGGVNYNPPSRFLREIPDELINRVGDHPSHGGRVRTAYGGPRYPDMDRANARWRVGQEVAHARWGSGVITSLSGFGEKAEATIWFSDLGEKRLLLAYAPIRAAD